jgi:hypothetical protein
MPEENFHYVAAPGLASSVQFGVNLPSVTPFGSLLTVSDIESAGQQLAEHGVDTNDVFHCKMGSARKLTAGGGRVGSPHPERRSDESFVPLEDLDGHGWLLKEVSIRLPGRVAGDPKYAWFLSAS